MKQPVTQMEAANSKADVQLGKLTIGESEENIDKAEIFDMQGKMVVTNENASEINVSALPQGNYLVRITTEKGVSTRTFVKE